MVKNGWKTFLPVFLFAIALSIPFEDLSAQKNEISGVVRDSETYETLPGVNVFLDKTNRGTSTNQYGRFHLDDIPDGLYTVVVSMVGYKKAKIKITFPRDKPEQYEFLLNADTLELGEVVVVEERPKEWFRNLDKFKEYFLGFTWNADETEILNPEVLEFNTDLFFKATALKPLKIKNYALGYDITFFLDQLTVKNQVLKIDGHSLYTAMNPEDKNKLSDWIEERKRAFNGSYRHFIQSLNDGNYYAQGFRIHLTDALRMFMSGRRIGYGSRYEKFKEQKVEDIERILTPAEPGQLALSTRGLNLPYIRVKFTNEEVEQRLAQQQDIDRRYYQISWIELPRGKAVIDLRSGGEVNPYRSVLHGYWGFSSRIPDLLPANYNPETHQIPDISGKSN